MCGCEKENHPGYPCNSSNCRCHLPPDLSGRLTAEKALGYQDKAKVLVVEYYNDNAAPRAVMPFITTDDVFVVWFAKTLQNWKALLSTTAPHSMYYELTYDGDKKATYMDVYQKYRNVTILD